MYFNKNKVTAVSTSLKRHVLQCSYEQGDQGLPGEQGAPGERGSGEPGPKVGHWF